MCDVWEKYGSGLTNLHGSTGDLVLLGTTTDNIQTVFDEVSNFEEHPMDLGSGSNLRTSVAVLGPLVANCNDRYLGSLL